MGALFENLFENRAKRGGITVTRMPDGCRQLGKDKLIRVATPFDWILSYQGQACLIDTKTTDGDRFPFSKIEAHQARELLKHHEAGTIAGYVIWFRLSDEVVFIGANLLADVSFRTLAPKPGSFKADTLGVIPLGRYQSDLDVTLIFKGGMNGRAEGEGERNTTGLSSHEA